MDLDFALAHGPKGSVGDPECILLLLTPTKKLFLVIYCDPTAETGVSFRTHERKRNGNGTERMDRQT